MISDLAAGVVLFGGTNAIQGVSVSQRGMLGLQGVVVSNGIYMTVNIQGIPAEYYTVLR